jgi:hypothetical protein
VELTEAPIATEAKRRRYTRQPYSMADRVGFPQTIMVPSFSFPAEHH